MNLKLKNQTGQVGVIVLLTMAGMLTVGLSLATRTTQESLLSGKETETARVFNAAEQGVEEALSGDLDFEGESISGNLSPVTGVDVQYDVTKVNSLRTRLFEGISVGVDVTGASDGNELRIDWSKIESCADNPASLVISIFFDDAGTTRVRHEGVAACDNGDNFATSTEIDGDYEYRYNLTLQSGDFLVRIKPVYNDTNISVSSTDFTLPVQYYSIRSEATNPTTNETRIIEVNRTLSTVPSVFDYAVYSGSDLVK